MSNFEDIPQIRDMVFNCKRCRIGGFADAFNKDGLCHECAAGKKPVIVHNIYDGEEDWFDL